MAKKKTLESEIDRVLPVIDDFLGKRNLTLSQRPLEAASMWVRDFVLEVSNDTKDEYYKKPWFASIFAVVMKWYERKYGAALKGRNNTFEGVVWIYGKPFLVDVPVTHSEPEVLGETVWLSFEARVGSCEKPTLWIREPPAFDAMPARVATNLDEQLVRLTTGTRALHTALMTSDPPQGPSEFEEFRNIALLSLGAAATHIVQNTDHSISLAAWDLNFALENVLKALIAQAGQSPRHVHDLAGLLDDAKKLGRAPFPKRSIAMLPNGKEAISFRYGKRFPGGTRQIEKNYERILDLMVRVARRMERSLDATNARVLLARPPWFAALPEFAEKKSG
jgi:hypothetical protein